MSQDNRYQEREAASVLEEEPVGYEYTADVKAWETLINILRVHGIDVHEVGGRRVVFTSLSRVDMKGMKENGVLWSYAVAKVKRVKELVEIG